MNVSTPSPAYSLIRAELLFPRLDLSHGPGANAVPALNGPFGEIIANEHAPKHQPVLAAAS